MYLKLRHKVYKLQVILLSCLILYSCNTTQLKPDESAQLSPKNGVLVASVVIGEEQGNILTKKGLTATFNIRRIDRGYGKDNILSIHSHPVINLGLTGKNELKENSADGRVVVIALPPDQYEILSWVLEVGLDYKKIYSKNFSRQLLLINEKEITYLGELKLEPVYGEKDLFGPVESGAQSKCTDMYERDINIFKKKYNALNDWAISSQLINC